MPGTRGTLPWHTSESSRQQGVPHGKTERRILGAPLRVEKRTLYKLIGGCTMIFSRRRIVPAPAIIAGRGGMVRLRSGRFDWTVQVGYPPPLTESGERRRAQDKAIRLTMGFLQKTWQRQSREVHRSCDWTSTRVWD